MIYHLFVINTCLSLLVLEKGHPSALLRFLYGCLSLSERVCVCTRAHLHTQPLSILYDPHNNLYGAFDSSSPNSSFRAGFCTIYRVLLRVNVAALVFFFFFNSTRSDSVTIASEIRFSQSPNLLYSNITWL